MKSLCCFLTSVSVFYAWFSPWHFELTLLSQSEVCQRSLCLYRTLGVPDTSFEACKPADGP